ncbi:MAG: S26 family signal peptidase [Actinobacteria bacterium]|nr:S26 family signal peptidase [Actinomycetota bacterium]
MRRIVIFLGLALAATALAGLVRRLVAYEVVDASMEPTLHPGDRVVGLRGWRARRGDVVVLAHPLRPGFEMVRRVVGGDGEDMGRVALGRGEVWALADNPEGGGVDSRALGPIRAEWLRARLFLRYHPGPVAALR